MMMGMNEGKMECQKQCSPLTVSSVNLMFSSKAQHSSLSHTRTHTHTHTERERGPQ